MLYNSKLYNGALYNGGGLVAPVYSTDTLVFDDFSLSDGSTMVMTDLRVSGPSRELLGGKIPRGHGHYLTDDQFGEYEIEAAGVAKAASAAASQE